VGRDPLGSANHPALLIAQGALEAISENVKAGSVLVRGDAVGHWWAFDG
jgi:hypothetical protein